ncbi:MAG: hypothetical protein U9M90_04345 [Patescibacteria group bacterium]|nr:hypothetical protein [Patescibacteria group bacterium]
MTRDELLSLDPKVFDNFVLSQDEILSWFSTLNAFWEYSGNPKDPHAKLTTGKCSNGFFDCLRVIQYLNLSRILANQLAKKIRKVIGNTKVDRTIGSPMADIEFAREVGWAIGAKASNFVEKDPKIKGKMVWERMTIPENETVLQIEELTTTAGTLLSVRAAIDESNPTPINWLPVVGILVHRPPKLPAGPYDNRQIISLIEKEIWAVDPPCELCKKGSPRWRPKTHWKELTGKE